MAGSGGSNEIVVRLAMEMRGAGKAVTDKIKKDAGQNGAAAGKAFMAGIAKEAKKAESSSSGFDIFAGTNRSEKAAEVRGARAMGAFMKGVSKASKRAEKTIPGFDVFGGIKNEAQARIDTQRAVKIAEDRAAKVATAVDRVRAKHARAAARQAGSEYTGSEGYQTAMGRQQAQRAAWRKAGRASMIPAMGPMYGPTAIPGVELQRRRERARFDEKYKEGKDEGMASLLEGGNILTKVGKVVLGAAMAYGSTRIAKGVNMNRSFRANQGVLTGLIEPGAGASGMFSLGKGSGGAYHAAATMGMSPGELMAAQAAYTQSTGEYSSKSDPFRGGRRMAAVHGTMGMGVGAQAAVLSASADRSVKSATDDMAQMFGIAMASGIKEAARRPRFVQAFSDFMSQAHSFGGTTEGVGRLVSTISGSGRAAKGAYALPVAAAMHGAITSPDPMSKEAAYMRYLMSGYGAPGGSKDFFGAEETRAEGLFGNPSGMATAINRMRKSTGGHRGQMTYLLRNIMGMSQFPGAAKQLAGITSMRDVTEADMSIFDEKKAAARTPRGAQMKQTQDVELMRATEGLTDSFQRLGRSLNEWINKQVPAIQDFLDGLVDQGETKTKGSVAQAALDDAMKKLANNDKLSPAERVAASFEIYQRAKARAADSTSSASEIERSTDIQSRALSAFKAAATTYVSQTKMGGPGTATVAATVMGGTDVSDPFTLLGASAAAAAATQSASASNMLDVSTAAQAASRAIQKINASNAPKPRSGNKQ